MSSAPDDKEAGTEPIHQRMASCWNAFLRYHPSMLEATPKRVFEECDSYWSELASTRHELQVVKAERDAYKKLIQELMRLPK